MIQSCCAYNCTNRYVKGNTIKLRGFLHNDTHNGLLQLKGITSLLRKERKICSEHFLPSNYYPSSRELLKNSVLSVFDFPDHLRKQGKKRVPLKRLYVDEIQNDPEDYALPPGSSQQ